MADQAALGSPHRPAGFQALGAHQPAEAALANKRGVKSESHKRARSAGLRWQACNIRQFGMILFQQCWWQECTACLAGLGRRLEC